MAEDDDNQDPEQSTRINEARRRLLRNAIYIPPIVIGVVSLSQGCAPGSCNPSQCDPILNCHPNAPCNPRP